MEDLAKVVILTMCFIGLVWLPAKASKVLVFTCELAVLFVCAFVLLS